MSTEAGTAGRLRPPYEWRALIWVVFGLFMVILDTTVVKGAFRTLQREFAANVNDSQWAISVYAMTLGISTPIAGYLADRSGIKRIFVGGLAAFTLGSLLCGLAPGLGTLVAARLVQGAGGGVRLPLGMALHVATNDLGYLQQRTGRSSRARRARRIAPLMSLDDRVG